MVNRIFGTQAALADSLVNHDGLLLAWLIDDAIFPALKFEAAPVTFHQTRDVLRKIGSTTNEVRGTLKSL